MGQFSWKDCCDSRRAIKDDVYKTSYLLVPKEFEEEYGSSIPERCYDGYGHFGPYDVYDLVAIWNRKWLSENPDWVLHSGEKISNKHWYKDFADISVPLEEVVRRAREEDKFFQLRYIGIDIACYDEDNVRIKYPVKITYKEGRIYEKCKFSKSDPNQGW